MSLLNLLAAITGQEPPAPELEPTEVEGITVTAPAKAPPAPSKEQTEQRVPFNYNNQAAAQAVDQAVMSLPTPRGGSANPGIYGLLPEKMQHGTLRNVLGAIGDAFLVQSGNKPTYGPRMDRQRIGQAMAGYDPDDPDTVQAAIQRVAATGAADSIDLAKDMQKDFGTAESKRVTAEQTAAWREAQMGVKKANVFNSMAPKIQGLFYNTTDPEDYARKYAIAESIAQRVDPEIDATMAFGLVPPDQWEPGMDSGYGITSNQQLVSEDKAAGRDTTERGQDMTLEGRKYQADRGYEGRVVSADKATTATMVQGLIEKRKRGEEFTPEEQEFWDKQTYVKKRRAPASVATKAPAKSGRPTPTSADVNYLKAHPEHRAKWDQVYGAGSAAKILGK